MECKPHLRGTWAGRCRVAYADREMTNQPLHPKPEDEASHEQDQADNRRKKDESEKLERDRADEAGRRSREGT